MKVLRALVAAILSALARPSRKRRITRAARVRVIVPLAAGATSISWRALSETRSERPWASRMVVENRPGASSLVGNAARREGGARRYTLLAIANTSRRCP